MKSENSSIGPIVIVGGFVSWPRRYKELAETLRGLSGSEVHIVPITPLDWLLGFVRGHGQLVFEIATTVDKALLESDSKKAVIVGHSSGGVASRAYLGGDAPYGGRRYSGHRRVSHLITLGSPHFVKDKWPFSLLNEANELFPGALHKDSGIRYISVAGAAADGQKNPKFRRAYEKMVEDGNARGDGAVTVSSALLPDSEHLVFDDLFHDEKGGRWYGDREAVERWWPEELRLDERRNERRDDRITG
ncbi:MAG: lysophospholipase [Actinomycetota bacterium]|jgi:pimeloyl-ACP methyl ester carboxylesterase|nr:esterase [Rubrobacter sp.]MDQ3506914.1 lysophospholipase [Actinomycetota bacterium]